MPAHHKPDVQQNFLQLFFSCQCEKAVIKLRLLLSQNYNVVIMPPKRKMSTPTMMVIPWNGKSADAKLLQSLIENGDVTGNDKPKNVHESRAEFGKYSLSSFRGAFNRAKADNGLNVRHDGKFTELLMFIDYLGSNSHTTSLFPAHEEGYNNYHDSVPAEGLEISVSHEIPPSKKKTARRGIDFDPAASRSELIKNDENAWHPIYILTNWTDSKMNQRCTMVLLLPTGVAVADTKDVSLAVVEDGHHLVVMLPWPDDMTNPNTLKDILEVDANTMEESEVEDSVLRRFAIKTKLAEMRPTAKDKLMATARFELGEVPMDHEIKKIECVTNKKGMRLLVIDMMAAKKSAYGSEEVQAKTFRELKH
jgi:hypothetical protein